MLKIKKDKLITFLDKIQMNGNIIELLFNFNDDGLYINAIDLSQVSMVNALLKKEVFTSYEALGEIGVQNVQEIIKILKSFNDEVIINKDGNLLTISENKYKVETELVDTEFIPKTPNMPALEFNENVIINSNELNSFIKNIKINRSYLLNIITEEKKLVLKNTGKYKFTKVIDNDTLKGGFNGTYSEMFDNSIFSLNDKITLSMNTNKDVYPIKISEICNDSDLTIIIAPITSTE